MLEMNTMDLGHKNVGKDENKTRNFGMKLKLPKQYLQNIPDDDLILFTDAWDVVYLDTIENILVKFINVKVGTHSFSEISWCQ